MSDLWMMLSSAINVALPMLQQWRAIWQLAFASCTSVIGHQSPCTADRTLAADTFVAATTEHISLNVADAIYSHVHKL